MAVYAKKKPAPECIYRGSEVRRDKCASCGISCCKKGMEGFIKEEAATLKEILIVSQLVVMEQADRVGVEATATWLPRSKATFESQELPGLKVWVTPAKGKKCERCWNYSERVGENKEHPGICERCWEAVD